MHGQTAPRPAFLEDAPWPRKYSASTAALVLLSSPPITTSPSSARART